MNAILSTLAVSASLFGAVQATVQGFDISNYQPSVDFSAAYSSGARFVIIKVRESIQLVDKFSGICNSLKNNSRRPRAQPTSTRLSPITILEPQMRDSFVVATTSHTQTPAPVQLKPSISLPTVAAGLAMASPFPECSTSSIIPTVPLAMASQLVRW